MGSHFMAYLSRVGQNSERTNFLPVGIIPRAHYPDFNPIPPYNPCDICGWLWSVKFKDGIFRCKKCKSATLYLWMRDKRFATLP